MDISDLKIFETVARSGGMKRAASELNTVQSNVTARIKALEADIGCALFDRHSGGVSLTPAGRRLLPYAEQAVRLLSDAKRAIGKHARSAVGMAGLPGNAAVEVDRWPMSASAAADKAFANAM
jgi:LysR family transcriptional regulator, cell division regulator